MRIAVLAGGRTPERDVSLRSGQRVMTSLTSLDHEAWLVDPGEVALVESLRERPPELCWLSLHGKEGEDGTVQRLLDLLGLPYTGTAPFECEVAFDKVLAKDALRRAGVRTPDWIVIEGWALRDLGAGAALGDAVDRVGLPCVVKPSRSGSALGVGTVERAADLPAAVMAALSFSGAAVVEAKVGGRGGERPRRPVRSRPSRWSRSSRSPASTITLQGIPPERPSISPPLGSTRTPPQRSSSSPACGDGARCARRHPRRRHRGRRGRPMGPGGERVAGHDRYVADPDGRTGRRHGRWPMCVMPSSKLRSRDALPERTLDLGGRRSARRQSGARPGPDPMISDTIRSRSSGDPNSMMTLPRLAPIWIGPASRAARTRSPRPRRASGTGRARRLRLGGADGFGATGPRGSDGRAPRSRRTDRSSPATRRASVVMASASLRDRSARAWPAGILPSASSCCTSSGRRSSRIVFAMCDRDTPSRSASVSCFRPSSSSSWRKASACSIGSRSSRWMFSMRASRRVSASFGVAEHDRERSRDRPLARPETALSRDQLVAHGRCDGPRWAGACRPPGSRRRASRSCPGRTWSAAVSGSGETALTGTSRRPGDASRPRVLPGSAPTGPGRVHLVSPSLSSFRKRRQRVWGARRPAASSRSPRARPPPEGRRQPDHALGSASGSAASSMTTTRRSRSSSGSASSRGGRTRGSGSRSASSQVVVVARARGSGRSGRRGRPGAERPRPARSERARPRALVRGRARSREPRRLKEAAAVEPPRQVEREGRARGRGRCPRGLGRRGRRGGGGPAGGARRLAVRARPRSTRGRSGTSWRSVSSTGSGGGGGIRNERRGGPPWEAGRPSGMAP